MNKKLAFKFNFLFIILVLFVAGSFIFTGAFFNNKTPQFATVSVDASEEADEVPGEAPVVVSASNIDLIADLDGWTESDPIVTPKKFTKIVNGQTFTIRFGTNDDEDKYRLFMSIYHTLENSFEQVQLTTDFETDLGLINGLIISGIKKSIVSGTESENKKVGGFSWVHSSDTETTTVYKMKYLDLDPEFTLTLAVANGEDFAKFNLFVTVENTVDVVYLIGSENGDFDEAWRGIIDHTVGIWLQGQYGAGFYQGEEMFEFSEEALLIFDIIAISGGVVTSICVVLIVGVWWYFIKNRKSRLTTSSTTKGKDKGKNKKSKRK